MSAPTGAPVPIDEDEAISRVRRLTEDDRALRGLVYTGGETEYAHIYLASVTGEYNGNRMLWLRYVWLSKPGAFESDMWGENGISMRLVDGLETALPQMMAATCQAEKTSAPADQPPKYIDVTED